MKRSSKILWGALLLMLVLSFTGIIAGRLYLNSIIGKQYRSEETIDIKNVRTETYSNTGFSSLVFTGNWKISITRGDKYSVGITGPSDLLKNTGINQQGNTLNISNENTLVLHDSTISVDITLPDLDQLNISGAVDLDFTGFTGDSLTIVLSGAGRIRGFDSRYKNLVLLCSGAGQLDLTECRAVDAEVNLSGAGEVLLNMDGGVLKGTISGLGSVEYSGILSSNLLDVSGLGSVSSR